MNYVLQIGAVMLTMVMGVDNKLGTVDCDFDIAYFVVQTFFRWFLFILSYIYVAIVIRSHISTLVRIVRALKIKRRTCILRKQN